MTDLLHQIYSFFLTLLVGSVVGAIIHFYQLTIRKSRLRKFFLYVLDFILWILLIILIFICLLLINLGEMRVYVFIALLTGILIYYRYAARSMHYPLAAGAEATVAGFSWCKRIFSRPCIILLVRVKRHFKNKAEADDPHEDE